VQAVKEGSLVGQQACARGAGGMKGCVWDGESEREGGDIEGYQPLGQRICGSKHDGVGLVCDMKSSSKTML